MKITTKRLKEIIMEEMDQLKEFDVSSPVAQSPGRMSPDELIGQVVQQLPDDKKEELLNQVIHQQLTDWLNEAPDDEKPAYGALLDLINTQSA